MTQPDQSETLKPLARFDATFRLYCDGDAHGRPSELWFDRETIPGTWSFLMPARFHGRDWTPDWPLDIKVVVRHLRGNTVLTRDMREPVSDFNFSPGQWDFSDTPSETDRLMFIFECPTCGISPTVRSEKLARILNRQIAAGKPDMTLQGLDYSLKLQR